MKENFKFMEVCQVERLFVIDLKDYDESWKRSIRPTVQSMEVIWLI